MRVLVFATLAVGSAAQVRNDPFQTGFLPGTEDPTDDQKQGLLTMMNAYREDHGACNTLVWDDSIVDKITSTINIVNTTSGTVGECYDASIAHPQGTSEFTQVSGYVLTWDPATTTGNGKLWDGADTVRDLMYFPGTQPANNWLWRSVSRVGCVVCRQGWINDGYFFFLTCMFEETTGTEADNVLPAGSTCDLCLGKPACDGAVGCKQAGVCNSTSGICEYLNAGDGTACDDSDATTTADMCAAGVCQGTPKCTGIVCNAVGECEESSTCDATTGQCVVTLKPNGTACDDGDAATQNDQCASGTCSGENLCLTTTCTALSQCHQAGTCDMSTGTCNAAFKPAGEGCDDGNDATTGDACDGAGVCVGWDLCYNVSCPTSQCVTSATCNPVSGACEQVHATDGTDCDDNNVMTEEDICTNGVCFGTNGCNLIDCTPTDTCQAVGICVNDNNQSAYCSYEYHPAGTSCDDGDATTARDTCRPGIRAAETKCVGSDLCANVTCSLGECKTSAVCNPENGTCSYLDMPDGISCDDGDASTLNDVCTMGECRGENICASVDCTAYANACSTAKCNSTTGQCDLVPKPQGTACDDGVNTTLNDQCTAGVCAGTDLCAGTTCDAGSGTCVKSDGRCDVFTGNCIYDNEADGTPCDDQDPNTNGDACFAGTCAPGTNCEVILRKQRSKAPCTAGKTYGFTPDGKFFVDNGCRGEFTIVANNHELTCSSWRWKYTECMTSPFLPTCSDQVAQPCPTIGPCLGYALTGEGNCVDSAGNPFNYLAVSTSTVRDCIEAARAAQPVAGAEFIAANNECRLLVPAGITIPPITGSIGEFTNSIAVAPVVSANGQAGVTCYVPEDRCLGVVCQPYDDCHVAGECQPATGMCTNPWKSDNSFCDDGDATTHTDVCSSGVCAGTSGTRECWVPSFWGGGKRECKNDASACGVWGAGSYATEQECCDKSFRNGCKSNPSSTTECWVADSYFPGTSCKKSSGDVCLLPIGAWSTEDDCCTPGAAHVLGCTGNIIPDGDDQIADRPEQCVCDPSLIVSPLTAGASEYCASKDNPNGDGHTCSEVPSSDACGSDAYKCRTPKSVPPTIGVACACGSFKNGCSNSHTRVCVDFSATNNACYPSNSNGACSKSDWFVCFTQVGYTVPVVSGSISSSTFKSVIATLAGVLASNVKTISSCSGSSKSRGHSSYSMKKSGCQTSSWGKSSRSAAVLDDEEDEITFQFTGLSTDEEIAANQKLMTNIDMATKGQESVVDKFVEDPTLLETIKDASTWVKGSAVPSSAPVGEGETVEEIDGDEEEDSSALTSVLVALGLAGCLGVVAAAFFINRRNPQGITVAEMSQGNRVDITSSDAPYSPVADEMEMPDESEHSNPQSPSVRI